MPTEPVKPRDVRLMAVNRGIVVGAIYAIVWALAAWFAPVLIPLPEVVLGFIGFVAGSIVAFSHDEASGGALPRHLSVLDAVVAALWTSIVMLTINAVATGFGGPGARAEVALRLMGFLAVGSVLGGMIGVPVLHFAARAPFGSYRPLLYANRLTTNVKNRDVRFVLRVLLHTVIFCLIAALSATLIAVVVGCALLYVCFWILSQVLGGEKESRAPSLFIPRGGRIRDDGRIVREGFFGDKETGQRITEDGRLVEEGLLFDRDTGMRIDEEGHVKKEGLIFDRETGIRLEPDGQRGRRVVKEGLIFDRDTGLGIDKEGKARREGLIFDREAGIEITADGKVSEVIAELDRKGRLREEDDGAARVVEEGLIFDRDTRVRIDEDGGGRREGILFDSDIDVEVGDDQKVREVVEPGTGRPQSGGEDDE